jgi:hypothetical protein
MYNRTPVGKFFVQACTTVCHLLSICSFEQLGGKATVTTCCIMITSLKAG